MLSSHPFPFGNRHAWGTKHLSLESRQRIGQPFRQRYAAVQAAHTAVPGEEAVQTCPIQSAWFGSGTLVSVAITITWIILNHFIQYHATSIHFIHTNSMAQLRANISCCMDHENKLLIITDLHCFLQSNCRLQKNSADSAWRTHFRAYYALSKDAASSPSEKKWIWRWNWRVAPFVQSWHPCHAL